MKTTIDTLCPHLSSTEQIELLHIYSVGSNHLSDENDRILIRQAETN